MEDGRIKRKQLTHKLERVALDYRRLKRPPHSVLDAATEFLRPVNQNKLAPESYQTLVDFVENVYFPTLKLTSVSPRLEQTATVGSGT